MEVQLKRPTPTPYASPSPYGVSQAWKRKFKIGNPTPTMMMSCKGVKGKSLTVEGDAFGFATTDVADAKQRWKKSEDPVRKHAFAIVHMATGKAIQIPAAAHEPVRLAPYDPNDTSLLWTATDTENDTDGGYSIIREFVDTNLVLDAVDLQAVVSNYNGSDNQLWKFEQADKVRILKLTVIRGREQADEERKLELTVIRGREQAEEERKLNLTVIHPSIHPSAGANQ